MDRAYWIKKYPKPDEDSIWCEECLRWEVGPGRFAPSEPPMVSKVLYRLASAIAYPGLMLARWLRNLGDIHQAHRQHTKGEMVVRSRST
jgi:hypothetical protein